MTLAAASLQCVYGLTPLLKGVLGAESVMHRCVVDDIVDPSGWWRGRLRGREGLFPNNYVYKL